MTRQLLFILVVIAFFVSVGTPTSYIDIGRLTLVGTSYANGGAMMCGKKIIHGGDSKHLLISRFGKPESMEFVGMAMANGLVFNDKYYSRVDLSSSY